MEAIVRAGLNDPRTLPKPLMAASPIEGGFKELHGCIVGRSQLDFPPDVIREIHHDETGLECLLSKVHIDACIDQDTPVAEMAGLGIAYANLVRDTLTASGVAGPFRIILSIREADEFQEATTCIVRFHRVRPGQEWLRHDLDSYGSEALMVWDFE